MVSGTQSWMWLEIYPCLPTQWSLHSIRTLFLVHSTISTTITLWRDLLIQLIQRTRLPIVIHHWIDQSIACKFDFHLAKEKLNYRSYQVSRISRTTLEFEAVPRYRTVLASAGSKDHLRGGVPEYCGRTELPTQRYHSGWASKDSTAEKATSVSHQRANRSSWAQIS